MVLQKCSSDDMSSMLVVNSPVVQYKCIVMWCYSGVTIVLQKCSSDDISSMAVVSSTGVGLT
jgi:hypothetical protein